MTLIAGELLGPYRLLHALGRGGQGVVWLAEPVSGGKCVALKTLEGLAPGGLMSFRREVRVLARARHPGVVRVLDQGTDRGIPWLAMEWIDGMGLLEVLAAEGHDVRETPPSTPAGPLPLSPAVLESVVQRGAQLCEPLAYLHGEGILHLDIKPSNILVRPSSQLVLVDLGLALRYEDTGREALQPLGAGSGTVAFAAPEQLRGEILDARTDLYALGVLLYVLLTRRLPFPTLAEKLAPNATPPSPASLVTGLPPELDRLILQLLRPTRRDRPGYADVVRRQLLESIGRSSKGLELIEISAPPGRASYLFRPELHGREESLRDVGRVLATWIQHREIGLLVLLGESGLGKTRLALEVVGGLRRRGLRVVLGEASGTVGPARDTLEPFGHFRELLQSLIEWTNKGLGSWKSLPDVQRALLCELEPGLLVLEPGRQARVPEELLPGEREALRLQAMTTLLLSLSFHAPLVLVLDDLQWADPATLAVLRQVLDLKRKDGQALLVIATCRSDELTPELERLLKQSRVEMLRLARLERHAIRGLVGGMLAMLEPPSDFIAFLDQVSDGNPFFVAEYLRTAMAQGFLLRQPGGQWQLAGKGGTQSLDFASLPLPRTLGALLQQRLAGLDPLARAVAQAGAVLGREFDEVLLAAQLEFAVTGQPSDTVSPLPSSAQLQGALDELLFRELLGPTPAGRLRFSHDQIRQVTLESLGERDRVFLHRAAAEGMESLNPLELPADDWLLRGGSPKKALPPASWFQQVGSHWARGGESTRAAVRYTQGAPWAAWSAGQAEAELLYRQALELLPGHDPLRPGLLLSYARDILYFRGEGGAAFEVLEQARALAATQSRPLEQAEALLLQARVLRLRGRIPEAEALATAALDCLPPDADAGRRAGVRTVMALLALENGRRDQAQQRAEQARVEARQAVDRRQEAVILGTLAGLRLEAGALEEAEGLCREAIALHGEVGNRLGEAREMGNLASIQQKAHQYELAHETLSQALLALETLGYPKELGMVHLKHAALLLEEGRHVESLVEAETALAIHEQLGHRRGMVLTLAVQRDALAGLGRTAEAAAVEEKREAFQAGGKGR